MFDRALNSPLLLVLPKVYGTVFTKKSLVCLFLILLKTFIYFNLQPLQFTTISIYNIYFNFWSVFSRIWTEYGEILRISPYSVRMRQNTDQKNSVFGHFTRSERRE